MQRSTCDNGSCTRVLARESYMMFHLESEGGSAWACIIETSLTQPKGAKWTDGCKAFSPSDRNTARHLGGNLGPGRLDAELTGLRRRKEERKLDFATARTLMNVPRPAHNSV
eukprot:1191287-Prorocentrum_minimum.AAC.3